MAEVAAAGGDAPAATNDVPNSAPGSSVDDSPGAGSSDSGVLTPEERDNQTIRELLGETAPAGKVDDEEDAEGEETPAAGDTATAETEDDAEPDVEITDELIDALLDAYGEEELLKHPRVLKRVEERVQSDTDRKFEERQKATSTAQEAERLVQQGRGAVTAIYDQFTKASEEFAKANRGEEFDPAVLKSETLAENLRSYGSAVVLEVKRGFDNAFTEAFKEGVLASGAPLSTEESEAVVAIVNNANRIDQDPKQGGDAAKAHLFIETTKMLVARARAAGKAEALAEVSKRKDAIKKLVGDGGENAVKAATAKLAKVKRNLPAAPVAASTDQDSDATGITIEAYQAAKRSGDHAKADSIAAARAARGLG